MVTEPRAAVYVRVSTKGQEEEGTSLETQEAACRQYAAAHGYLVADVYREVHTGVELWERPALTALREGVRQRRLDVVVCYAIDRLSRDPVHLGVLLSEADHACVAVEFVSEPLDNSPEGQLIRFVRGYAAKVEHEKFKERSRRGMLARFAAGKLKPGQFPLYGYRWRDEEKSGYEFDPATAPVVRRIFDATLRGVPLNRIVAMLADEGVASPAGKPFWSRPTLCRLLKHPAYMGRATALRYRSKPTEGATKLPDRHRPEEEQIALPDGVIPPIVDAATFDAVGARLALNRQSAPRNNHDPEATLLRGGYARCAYCGRALRVYFRERRHPAYICPRRMGRAECLHPSIPAAMLDAAVWSRIEAILRQPELIAAQLRRMQASDPTTADVAALDRELADVARKRANLARRMALFDDDEAAAPLVAELALLAKRAAALEEERATVLARREQWERAQGQLAEIERWCRAVATNLDALTYAQRRIALDALGVQARIWRSDCAPRWEITASLPLAEGIVLPSRSTTQHSRRLTLVWTDLDDASVAAYACQGGTGAAVD